MPQSYTKRKKGREGETEGERDRKREGERESKREAIIFKAPTKTLPEGS